MLYDASRMCLSRFQSRQPPHCRQKKFCTAIVFHSKQRFYSDQMIENRIKEDLSQVPLQEHRIKVYSIIIR